MRTYTKREIAHLLGVSPRTVADDANYLNLQPTEGDRGLKLFNERDFSLIQQMRAHCADKSNSRESFIPNTEVEIVKDEPQVTKLARDKKRVSNISLSRQAIRLGLEQDPFFDLEMLQRISNNNWLLPATRLAPLLNITAKYLNSKSKYSYGSFVCIKKGYVDGRELWRVYSQVRSKK